MAPRSQLSLRSVTPSKQGSRPHRDRERRASTVTTRRDFLARIATLLLRELCVVYQKWASARKCPSPPCARDPARFRRRKLISIRGGRTAGNRSRWRRGTGCCRSGARTRRTTHRCQTRRRARSAGRREIELEEQGGGGERNVNLHAPPPALTSNSENGVGSEYGRNSCKFVKIRGHPPGPVPKPVRPSITAEDYPHVAAHQGLEYPGR